MHTRQQYVSCWVCGGLPMRKGEIWAWQGNLSRTNGYCYPGQQKSTRPIKNMLQGQLRTDNFMPLSFPPAILIILDFRLQLWLMHLLIYSLIWWPLWNLLHSYLSTLKISVTRVVRLGAVWWVLCVCCPRIRGRPSPNQTITTIVPIHFVLLNCFYSPTAWRC